MNNLTFLDLAVYGLYVINIVLGLWIYRRLTHLTGDSDVAELAKHVEKIGKAVRSYSMQRVRAAAPAAGSAGGEVSTPFGPQILPDIEQTPLSKKAELRQRLSQKNNRGAH